MPKNEYLPFGTAANANVLPNADYQALPARSAGFTAGVAKSKELNTAWRQASVIANVVAQFIADKSGKDVLDNGDTAGLLSSLEMAFAAQTKETLPFSQSLTANGYQKLPSGLIIQWGGGVTESNGNSTVKFPLNYPTKVLQVLVSPTNTNAVNLFITANVDNTNYKLTGFDVSTCEFNLETSMAKKKGCGFTWVSFGL
ncbi:gp53-like domain-containing protein [Serratia fonticola]